ncbi:hypothetical protein MC885_016832 [Smutsia gigantea]|nr:hypothetical protein MC885_016832 [Smutsia gigantea]
MAPLPFPAAALGVVLSQSCRRGMFPNELCRYGYVTNSKVKFVMVVDSSNTALRDNEIRSMFRKLHSSYTDVMCNPFYNPGDRIQSRWADALRGCLCCVPTLLGAVFLSLRRKAFEGMGPWSRQQGYLSKLLQTV